MMLKPLKLPIRWLGKQALRIMKYNYMTVLLAVAIISSGCVNRHREYDERETTEEAVEVIEVTAVDVIEECADTVAEATDVFDTEVVVVEDPVVVV